MKKITYYEFKNTKEYKISEEYSVVFFTIGRCAFFRFFSIFFIPQNFPRHR